MTGQITVTLPAEVLQRAEQLARRSGRPVNELLAETIELSLRPLGTSPETDDLADCSDEVVLQKAEAQLPASQDQRLSALLERQQAGVLTDPERLELAGLM